MSKPTYHYDKNVRMIYEFDYVRCDDGKEGTVLWIENKWTLNDVRTYPSETLPLNLYAKNQLEIV